MTQFQGFAQFKALTMILYLCLTLVVPTVNAKTQDSQHPFLESVTKGAASGYLPDIICGNCHKNHFETYQEVGMSHSFSDVNSAREIEDFSNSLYFHEKSSRYYEMKRDKGGILFSRYQKDSLGQRINEFEINVDWVLGSGNRSRSYLFQVPSGKIYQLPISWYTQIKKWKMAPGYDKQFHIGLRRPVRRECMFCHNAFPEVAIGSDVRGKPQVFPTQLPHGTGCQRCHGPGENHVTTALKSNAKIEDIHSAIVNPSKLSKEKEMQICFQCHLLPSVGLVGIRRFDVTDYSFRPGTFLNDYMLHVDIEVANEIRSERFEINHHPYRLMQSQCFIKSSEKPQKMTCITCHDPHVKAKGKERLVHFRDACLQCHVKHDRNKLIRTLNQQLNPDDINYVMKQTIKDIDSPQSATFNPDNCFACHMPQNRTDDVVNVTMTDHLISKKVAGKSLLAPKEESLPIITDLEFYEKEKALKGVQGEIYRVVTIIRQLPTKDSVDYLDRLLNKSPPKSLIPYSDLATGLFKIGRYQKAENILKEHLIPINYPGAEEQLATIYIKNNQVSDAISILERLIKSTPLKTSAWYNLGLAYSKNEQFNQAEKVFKEAVRLDPVLEKAWYYLGLIYLKKNKKVKAIVSLKKALAINPAYSRAYLELVKILKDIGELSEAKRYIVHGKKVSNNPETQSDIKF